jgi:5-hydroxyisourate hydrolase-like protein (transthyretin family)
MVTINDLDYELVFHVGKPLVNRVKCNHLVQTSFDTVITMVFDVKKNISEYYSSVSVRQHGQLVCQKSLSADLEFFYCLR